jgi:hypothetical protein
MEAVSVNEILMKANQSMKKPSLADASYPQITNTHASNNNDSRLTSDGGDGHGTDFVNFRGEESNSGGSSSQSHHGSRHHDNRTANTSNGSMSLFW